MTHSLAASPLFLAGTLSLAACGNAAPIDEEAVLVEDAPPLAATGAPLELEPLSAQDLAVASLDGELGCAFSRSRGADPLLTAYSFVAADAGADAAIKLNGATVPLSMNGAGGYERMSDGGTFMGDDVMASIVVTGTDPLADDLEVARESPAFAAVMTVSSFEREIAVQGIYACGP